MLWILLPANNEEDSIQALFPKIKKVAELHKIDYHIVVVDDGSTDRTSQILIDYRETYPLSIITHDINRGLGETERNGFEFIALNAESDDILVRMDCDDTHEPMYIEQLLGKINAGFDVISTSRFRPGGGEKGLSLFRSVISRSANIFMNIIFRVKGIRDYSSGYRAYRVKILQDALKIFGNNFIQLRGLGFTSTLETIVKLNMLGARFSEVPFVLRYDQKVSSSKMIASITTIGYFTMALLYHWPWGGWKSQYRGLRHKYRSNDTEAIEHFSKVALPQKTFRRISS